MTDMQIIRSFNAIRFFIKKFDHECEFYLRVSLKSFAKSQLATTFSEVSRVIVVEAILIYGGGLILYNHNVNDSDQVDAGSFIAFLVIFSQVIRPTKEMVLVLAYIQRGQAVEERILHFIDTPYKVQDNPNVSFKCTDKVVIENISFVL